MLRYLLDRDLSNGERHPPLEHPGSGRYLIVVIAGVYGKGFFLPRGLVVSFSLSTFSPDTTAKENGNMTAEKHGKQHKFQ